MYSDWVSLVSAGILLAWLGGLTFVIWKTNTFLKSLFPKSGERDIRKKFEEVIRQVSDFKQDLNRLENDLFEVRKSGLKYIQKVELFRYNPYDDTGGDQSFTLALLDSKGDGIVLTSLHARSGTRVFAKPVNSGESKKYGLSKEEEKVVREVMS